MPSLTKFDTVEDSKSARVPHLACTKAQRI